MKYGIAKHHVTISRDNFTPGEVIPAKNLDAVDKKTLDRLVKRGAVEIAGENEADKAWEEANQKHQKEAAATITPDSGAEEPATDEQETESDAESDAEAAEDVEELKPMELDGDDIITPDAEEEAPPAKKPAAKRTAKKEAK